MSAAAPVAGAVLTPHPDVVVVVSRLWETTATLVRAPGADAARPALLVDAPVLPDEIALVPAVAAERGFAVERLVATHRHWDHLLGRLCFPDVALACSPRTLAHVDADPPATARAMADFDDRYYLVRPQPLRLDGATAATVPGALPLGEAEVELIPTAGHCDDGLAVWVPWARTLLCGDYLSPVEVPYLEAPDGDHAAYVATLERLAPYVVDADVVVPGHGAPLGGAAAARILDEDLGYLAALARDGASAALPRCAESAFQRFIHDENVNRIGAAP